MKGSCTVTVLDQKLLIRSEAEASYVGEVAAFVNQKIQEVIEKASSASTLQAALLVCMNVADELIQSRKETKRVKDQVTQEVRSLILEIDAERQQVL